MQKSLDMREDLHITVRNHTANNIVVRPCSSRVLFHLTSFSCYSQAIQGVEDKPGGSRRSRVRLHQLSCSVWEPLEINSALLPATLSPDLRAED